MICIERMPFSNGTSMANSKSGDKFVDSMGRLKAQTPLLTHTATGEIKHCTEMGIGMVMPTDHLIPIAQHGPTSLKVQSHLRTLKAHRLEISPCLIRHLLC